MAPPKNPSFTKEKLTAVALRAAQVHGFEGLTQARVADLAGCSYGLITLRFGTMTGLRRDVMRAAVAAKCLPVIATGLALKHPTAKRAPKDLREKALATFSA